MATKQRIGLRCYNPFVPNEVWTIFKQDLRKMFKIAFPAQKFSITEFYWQGFSVADEYIRIKPLGDDSVDWHKVWKVLDFVAHEFGMTIDFLYQEEPIFKAKREDDLFPRKYGSYSLKNIRTWTTQELDDFIESHTFQAMRDKYNEI